MSSFKAIVRAADGKDWQLFQQPEVVLVATTHEEVREALARVEKYCSDQGWVAVGYVSYEAAPAFDPALVTRTSGQALLKFGLFREARRWLPPSTIAPLDLPLGPELGKPDYERSFTRIKHHLEAGDSYQVNFTQRLRGHFEADPIDLFAALVNAQPSAHAFFLQDEAEAICSVSPELFFRLDNDLITMAPMKGTQPRAAEPDEDQALKQRLLESEKERAENLMIVDMVRNDLARVADPGSVQVTELFKILELPTVWQQVSVVQARTSASLLQLFDALFPCASITGAPKKQTMSIIRNLEISPRGIYTGALGVVRPGRHMHFNVGIRSLHLDLKSNHASYGTGSGIVWDSTVDAEWQETRVKARLLEQPENHWQLLETLVYLPGQGINLLEEHLSRLQRSAEYFGIRYDDAALRRLLTAYHSDSEQRLRLLMSQDGRVSLESAPRLKDKGPVTLALARQPIHSRNVFLQHKTTNRTFYDRALGAFSGEPHIDDVLLWNEREELTETTIYNIFLEFAGALLTPALSSGLLPGTLRADLLAKQQCREAVLTKADLAGADKILVGNSVRGMREAVLTTERKFL